MYNIKYRNCDELCGLSGKFGYTRLEQHSWSNHSDETAHDMNRCSFKNF